MALRKLHVPGCCTCCQYTLSNGNHYTDSFDSLDAGWLKSQVGLTIGVGSGRFFMESPSLSGDKYSYRNATVTQTGLLIVMEAQVYEGTIATQAGLFFGAPGTAGTELYKFALFQNYVSNNYVAMINGSGITQALAPVDGDLLTIKLRDIGSNVVEFCAFVNNEPIVRGTLGLGNGTYRYGPVMTSASGAGTGRAEWDNFTIHIGNP